MALQVEFGPHCSEATVRGTVLVAASSPGPPLGDAHGTPSRVEHDHGLHVRKILRSCFLRQELPGSRQAHLCPSNGTHSPATRSINPSTQRAGSRVSTTVWSRILRHYVGSRTMQRGARALAGLAVDFASSDARLLGVTEHSLSRTHDRGNSGSSLRAPLAAPRPC
jgi:hypothetical protein